MPYPKGVVEWRRYGPCPMCEAPLGEPCVSAGGSRAARGAALVRPHRQRQHTRGRGHVATIPAYYVQPVHVDGKDKYAVMRERNGRHRAVVTYLDREAANRAAGMLIGLAASET